MRILQVTPRYPPQSGGVETHVEAVSERLVERGYDVTVVTADAGGDGQRRECRNGVDVRRYRSIAPANAVHFCPQITSAVRTTDVDIVHAHNYHSFPLFFAAIGVNNQRFIVTTHYHGGSASSVRDRLLSLYHPLGRWAVRQADKVIAVSEWEKEQLSSDFRVDAKVVPNGVDVTRFSNSEAANRGQPYILTVGRLEEYKGVQHVIRAMTELPEYDLLVAGRGPYREELEKIAREECVKNQVEFLGYIDDDKLSELYLGAMVYVTLSNFESYGMTVAEALAAGTPCVVRENRGLKNWLTNSGVIGVREVSTNSICCAINTAIRSQVETDSLYVWDDTCEEISAIYEKLLSNAVGHSKKS